MRQKSNNQRFVDSKDVGDVADVRDVAGVARNEALMIVITEDIAIHFMLLNYIGSYM